MSDFTVIGVVGPPASGKSVVASRLVELGAKKVRMGDIVWNEVRKRNMEVNEENVGEIANRMREEEGMDAVAKKSIPVIERRGERSDAVVVDGIRGIAEVERFEEHFGENFVLVSVEASEKTRFERVKERGREDDIGNFESFKEKDEREFGWGLRKAMEGPDFVIKNEGTLEELEKEVDEIYEKMREKHETSGED